MERFVAHCESPHPSRGALCVERQSAPQAFLQHCVTGGVLEACTLSPPVAAAEWRLARVCAA